MEGEKVETTQPTRKRNWFLYYGLFVGAVMLSAVVVRYQHTIDCSSDVSDGEWLNGVWLPHYCVLHQYTMSDIARCLSGSHRVVVLGDERWFSHANLLCQAISQPAPQLAPQPLPQDAQESQHKTAMKTESVEFHSHHYLDQATFDEYYKLAKSANQRPVVVIHQSLILHSPGIKEPKLVPSTCRDNVHKLIEAQHHLLNTRPGSKVIQLAPAVVRHIDDAETEETMEVLPCAVIARHMYKSAINSSSLLYLSTPFEDKFPTYIDLDLAVPQELSVVLNTFCPVPLSCCAASVQSYHHFFIITILIFILAVYLGLGLIILSGATFALIPHLEVVNFNLQQFINVFHSVGGVALVLLYLLLADGTGYFMRVGKQFSPILFILFVVVMILVGALSCRKAEKPEFLSSDQCKEWRGWMVLVYIALQYCDMEQAVSLHLFGELLVGGVVFISGYCHFMSYWNNTPFSWRRVALVLLRQNMYPMLVCFVLGTSYGGYCLPLLLSVGFLFTSAFMASWPQITLSSMQGMGSQGPQQVVVAVKFGVAFLLCSFLPWLKDIVNAVVSLPVVGPLLQSHQGSAETLYHTLHTHRYMTLGGMVLGYVVSCLQAGSSHTEGGMRLKLLGAVFSTAILLGYGLFLVTAWEHSWSIESHSLIAVPVLVSYAVLRNLSSLLQCYTSSLLSKLGFTSLWLFVSSHHILLALNGSALLLLFPNKSHLLNFILVLSVFLCAHVVVTTAVNTIRQYRPCGHKSPVTS